MVTAQSIKLQRQRLLKIKKGFEKLDLDDYHGNVLNSKKALHKAYFFLFLMLGDIIEQIDTPDIIEEYNTDAKGLDLIKELEKEVSINVENLKTLYLQAPNTPTKPGHGPFFPTHFITAITSTEEAQMWLNSARYTPTPINSKPSSKKK